VGGPYFTNIFAVKSSLALAGKEGKHLDSTMTEETLIMQLHSSATHRQTQIHYGSLMS